MKNDNVSFTKEEIQDLWAQWYALPAGEFTGFFTEQELNALHIDANKQFKLASKEKHNVNLSKLSQEDKAKIKIYNLFLKSSKNKSNQEKQD